MGAVPHQMSLKPFVKANCYKPHKGEEGKVAEAYIISSC